MFASLRCNVDRASPSATTGMIEMSSAWRDDSWGTDCSNPFSATGESYKPDHSDNRVPSDEHLGKPGNVGGPGNADDNYSLKNPPSCPPEAEID